VLGGGLNFIYQGPRADHGSSWDRLMTWREKLLVTFGSGYFLGITLGDWMSLLRESGFAVAPSYLPRAMVITACSLPNTIIARFESLRFRRAWERIEVPPPVFVLGHYRSGTTHLHNLLAVDERFAYLNAYQASYPDTFLLTENIGLKLLDILLPSTRPADNVRLGANVPYEDETALTNSGHSSPYMSSVFPRRREHYDRFLTFRSASEAEIERWRAGFLQLMQKLTLRYGKPLVLKSPAHTCRIKLLLDMFPRAKFVHIHRDPYTVIQSTMHLVRVALPWSRLQDSGCVDWTERTLSQWREMYDAYFEERALIPADNLYDMAFADLERDPLSELRRMYVALDLPPFDQVESAMRDYLASLADYQKNKFVDLSVDLKARVAECCARGFDEWGYPR
jgi:hypothetical protein